MQTTAPRSRTRWESLQALHGCSSAVLDFSRNFGHLSLICSALFPPHKILHPPLGTYKCCLSLAGFVSSVTGCWHATRSPTTRRASWSATSSSTGPSTPCTAAASRTASKIRNSKQTAATSATTAYHFAPASLDSPATCSSVGSNEIRHCSPLPA